MPYCLDVGAKAQGSSHLSNITLLVTLWHGRSALPGELRSSLWGTCPLLPRGQTSKWCPIQAMPRETRPGVQLPPLWNSRSSGHLGASRHYPRPGSPSEAWTCGPGRTPAPQEGPSPLMTSWLHTPPTLRGKRGLWEGKGLLSHTAGLPLRQPAQPSFLAPEASTRAG